MFKQLIYFFSVLLLAIGGFFNLPTVFGHCGASTLPEDVNKDGIVNIQDLVLVATAFGQSAEPKDDSNPDVNSDGLINVLDLVRVSNSFGKTGKIEQSIQEIVEPLETVTDLTSDAAVIRVCHDGTPLSKIELLVLFPNKTWHQATTNDAGEARVDLYSLELPMTVYAAAPGFAASLEKEWVPAQGALAIKMQTLSGGGSAIFPERTGYLQELTGRLNPKLDTSNRTYLYARNIAINGGKQQPVGFSFGEDLHLVDAWGKELMVRIVLIVGSSVLVEYRPVPKIEN